MAKIPEMIGKYRVESLIAQGGMGAVYKAWHPTLKRPVILKRLTLLGKKDITERFRREARILMDLSHDNIVSMYDHFKEGNSYYLVLEFVDGLSLEQILRKNRYLPSGVAAYILLELSKALQYAHSQKVVHRDIKPGNVLISQDGRVKLVDFGIAAISGEKEDSLTREGMTLGTPSYMPQEQFEDSRTVDHRADIYSLGVLAYEMLTGKKPYPGAFSPELLTKIQRGKYIAPGKVNPDVYRPLRAFIRKAMKVKRESRYQDLEPVVVLFEKMINRWNPEELKVLCAEAARGREVGVPSVINPKRRIFGFILIGAGVLVLAATLCVTVYFQSFRALTSSKTYGGLVFSVSAPKDYDMILKNQLELTLYLDDDDEIPSWEGPGIVFQSKNDSAKAARTSRRVFVPAGAYRAKISLGREVFWTSFVVQPWAAQRKTGDGPSRVEFQVPEFQPRPLDIVPEIVDGLTGEDLKDKARAFVFQGGRWLPLDSAKDLRTGTVVRIRIEAPGYKEKLFSLRIGNGQDVLFLQAGLVPLENDE